MSCFRCADCRSALWGFAGGPDRPCTTLHHLIVVLPQGRRGERCRPRRATEVANGYDLSLNRYKEVVHEEVEHLPPMEVLQTLAELEEQIQQGMKELKGMLG